MRTAVLGHVEWVELLEVDHVPATGEIVHGDSVWVGPAGGGPDAAVQLLKLAGEAILFTALGDDALGHRAKEDLEAMGLRVEAAFRKEPTRRAITHIDSTGERTITVIGPRFVDRYGAGDAFAGGLTYAIAKGMEDGAAVEFAALCGAAVLTGRGPYEGQLTQTSP